MVCLHFSPTVNSVIPEASLVIDPQLTPPTDLQCKLLRQILLMGLGDHVARKIAAPPLGTEDRKKLKMAYQVWKEKILLLNL